MTSSIWFACRAFKKQISMACFRKQSSLILPRGFFDSTTFSYKGSHTLLVKTSKSLWSLRSSADGNPSPSNSSSGTTRLIKIIQNLQIKLNDEIQKVKKNFPLKFLFFLVGFYSATAFSTVIGQTGDWDILSAALAVVVVEGIGALMYRTSPPFFNRIRSLIIMFNYWKAGLSLGLFLDSFKYKNVLKMSKQFPESLGRTSKGCYFYLCTFARTAKEMLL